MALALIDMFRHVVSDSRLHLGRSGVLPQCPHSTLRWRFRVRRVRLDLTLYWATTSPVHHRCPSTFPHTTSRLPASSAASASARTHHTCRRCNLHAFWRSLNPPVPQVHFPPLTSPPDRPHSEMNGCESPSTRVRRTHIPGEVEDLGDEGDVLPSERADDKTILSNPSTRDRREAAADETSGVEDPGDE
ncbi:hypothetical protein EV363DRAFT_151849 [Boletus edulis]|nr:hypothetical protein EV363DRAFT_151849 [Boletus edulis]